MSVRSHNGVTLVELAIALVVIGLLVSGVITGQELVKQAEVAAEIRQLEEINRAVLTFRLKYNALPGDFDNATSYWGVLSDCASDDRTGNTATCNGDGNGIIGATGTDTNSREHALFYQHLANSELMAIVITGSINGAASGLDPDLYESISFLSKIKGSDGAIYITVTNSDNASSRIDPAVKMMPHYFVLGSASTPEDWMFMGPALTPIIAYALDSKLDDGMPTLGKIVTEAAMFGNTRCRNGASPEEYDITDEENTCALFIGANF